LVAFLGDPTETVHDKPFQQCRQRIISLEDFHLRLDVAIMDSWMSSIILLSKTARYFILKQL